MIARKNPYRSGEVLKIRYRFQQGSMADLLRGLARLNFRAAITGPEGSGKTTLLEDLQIPLSAQGKKIHWFRFHLEQPRFSPADRHRLAHSWTTEDLILCDGAEVLGPWRFRLLQWQTRKAGGLVITNHRPGLLPTLLRTSTTPELLGGILQSLDPKPPEADILWARHGGNLREALREMYDRYSVS